ncbi:RNA 2',3'-cyclic phosphodiesterase [Pontibacter sp. KCTC 32443]|uniref:RNA 2',3'-cyclic phosphodiesterase n=1 Tax=Pontibacter TaxID=323449 RepID=UPI00164D60A1|nr:MULTISPECIES: RNA 2',3'-cyclic phosphodiesterase [Pontibacter]MBC5773815.1 RNA 2',3'-cyclic phosphodiesterase [Pontibacter sp. KCTC 32443]
MNDTIRLFIAAPLTDELGPYLKEELRPFLDDTLRPIPLQNLHLTLFFIGNVPATELDTIRKKVKEVAQQCKPFDLLLEAVEQGPKPKTPRLIWARFQEHPEFAKLSIKLAQALAPDEPNKLKPTPHITIARYRKNITRPEFKAAVFPENAITLPVTTIGIWKSDLATPHPVYSILESYLLGQNLT